MRNLLLPVLFAASVSLLPAQATLAELQQKFSAQAQQLGQSPTHEQRDQLLARQVAELEAWLPRARGDDRWNARLMLADMQLARNDEAAAGKALRGIDKSEAPGLALVTAAAMAQRLGLDDLRGAWVEAALTDTKAPLPERFAMARLLTTVLREVERGEAIFTQALTAAKNDDERAFVRWHHADAMRDREDLPDGAAFEEMEKLAKEMPDTYWGSVAKDRLRATQLKVGDDAIAFTAKSTKGEDVSLAAMKGKAVVLAFFTRADLDTPMLVRTLRELKQQAGPALAIVGISLDRDGPPIDEVLRELGIDFPVVHDGKGIENDVPLRWFVEGPVVHVIDAQGRIAALGLHAGTADGRAEMAEAVERAVKAR